MYQDTDGIIIRQIKTSDGRRMLVIFTKRFGKISAGTSINERGKNKSALAIRPFTHGHYDLFKSSGGYNLNNGEVRNSFFKIGEDVDKFMMASQALEFVDKLLPEEEKNESIFDLLVEFLDMLSDRKKKLKTLYIGFQIRALKYAGIVPELKNCISCGKTLSLNDKIYFSISEGGLLCDDCRRELLNTVEERRKELIYSIDFGIVDILRYFASNPLESLKKVGLDDEKEEYISKLMLEYVKYHLGIEEFKTII